MSFRLGGNLNLAAEAEGAEDSAYYAAEAAFESGCGGAEVVEVEVEEGERAAVGAEDFAPGEDALLHVERNGGDVAAQDDVA